MHYNESIKIRIDYDLFYILEWFILRVLWVMLKTKLSKWREYVLCIVEFEELEVLKTKLYRSLRLSKWEVLLKDK